MGLINTITGVAEGYMNDVTKWRDVLANNPSELPFKLPPSLQTDLDRYAKTFKNVTGQLNIKGLDKVDKLGGQAELVVNDIFKAVIPKAGKLVDQSKPVVTNVTSLLSQIDWLL